MSRPDHFDGCLCDDCEDTLARIEKNCDHLEAAVRILAERLRSVAANTENYETVRVMDEMLEGMG